MNEDRSTPLAQDPRKNAYLLNYLLQFRRGGGAVTSGSSSIHSTGNGSGSGSGSSNGSSSHVVSSKGQPVSLDEARLTFWLEAQLLFEMSKVSKPSRGDMTKVYDKFFRSGSGFYVPELADRGQVRNTPVPPSPSHTSP